MKEKMKSFLKKDGIFLIYCLCLIIYTVLLVVTASNDGTYTLLHPFNSDYAMISFIIIIVFGVLGFIFFRNADKKQIKMENIYLLLVIPIAIMFIISIPLGKIPDENTHMRRIVALADGIIFPELDEDDRVRVDYDENYSKIVNDKNDSYEIYQDVLKNNSDYSGNIVQGKYTNMALYSPVCHLPQVIGLQIVRLVGGNISAQAYGARVSNFIFSAILIYFAIKLIPCKKHILLLIALLPMTLNEIISLSSDSITIAMSLFWIGYVFYLKLSPNKKEITRKDIAILSISSVIVAMCKIVYLPVCLLIFIIPKEKFGSLKKKNIICSFIVVFSVLINLIWIMYASRFLVEYHEGVNSGEQVLFILRNPINYAIILFRTMARNSASYIFGICGAGISMLNVSVSDAFIYPCILLLAILFLGNEDTEFKLDGFSRVLVTIVFIGIIVLIYTSLYVQWTPVANSMINGVQARYFIPILLLSVFVTNNKLLIIDKKIQFRYVFMFLLLLNLNAITNIIYFYM